MPLSETNANDNSEPPCANCGGAHHYSICTAKPKQEAGIRLGPPKSNRARNAFIFGGLIGTGLLLSQCFNTAVQAPKPDLSAKYPSIAVASLDGSYMIGVGKDKSTREAGRKAVDDCRLRHAVPRCSIRVRTTPGIPTCVSYTAVPILNSDRLHVGQRFKYAITTQSRPNKDAMADRLCIGEKGNDVKMCRGRIKLVCNF